MKRVIKFTKLRYVMFFLSFLVIGGGITGTILNGGFNLGIDFQAGLNQRVQIAPVAMTVTYNGKGDASFEMKAQTVTVVLRGEHGVKKYPFDLVQVGTFGALAQSLNTIDGIQTELKTDASVPVSRLTTGLNYPLALTVDPAYLNVVNTETKDVVSINEVRSALSGLGNPQVQIIGKALDQEFQI